MRFFTILAVVVAVSLPAAGAAQEVEVEYDGDAAFDYTSYAWKEGSRAEDEITHQRIVNAIENQLAIHGLLQVPAEEADLFVVYHGSAERKEEVMRFGQGPPTWRDEDFDKWRYVVGTLVVELWDSESEKIVWRGRAEAVLSNQERRNNRLIDRAVEKMFEELLSGEEAAAEK